jgi:hypothetical protein
MTPREAIEEVKRIYRERTGQEVTLSDEQIGARLGQGAPMLGRPDDESQGRPQVSAMPEDSNATTAAGASSGAGGSPGTWETALMSVAKVAPSIIESARYRHAYAPASSPGGRRVLDIPTAGAMYGKNDPRFQSLLAALLRGR